MLLPTFKDMHQLAEQQALLQSLLVQMSRVRIQYWENFLIQFSKGQMLIVLPDKRQDRQKEPENELLPRAII